MLTIEGLKKKIQGTEDIQSIVKTMKVLAAVNIRQYEKAVESLRNYNRIIEMGLQIALRNRPDVTVGARPAPMDRLVAIIFGSDQGMCGQLNEQVASYALKIIEDFNIKDENLTVLAVGERVKSLIEESGQTVEASFSVPISVAGITHSVQEILITIEAWNEKMGFGQVFLFYNMQLTGATFRPEMLHLLPMDQESLKNIRQMPWPSKVLPTYTMDWDTLFSALIRQYLFVSLFRSLAESLASENASRLIAMQGAGRNIEERLTELNTLFHQTRQMSITEELLDIVAGFEALKKDGGRSF